MNKIEIMEFNMLEKSLRNLNEVINEFPIGAISLNDIKPIEEKIQMARQYLMHLNARLLMFKAKCKQYTSKESSKSVETDNALQEVTSDGLINAKAIKLCLHSTTISSIFDDKEGCSVDKKKIDAYMNKLLTINDNLISIQESLVEVYEIQSNLKEDCENLLFDYEDFLKEQEKIRTKELQEKYPDIAKNKNQMENTLQKINIMKKLIRRFIAVSGHMLAKEPIFLEILENHRESINVETILKMTKDNEDAEDS